MAVSRSRVLFSYAFRPLFLLATLYALIAVPVWVFAWVGWLPLPTIVGGNPIWWHAHEMLFGFAGAAVGGFLLTAVATWTGRPPVAGGPLVGLALLWLNARLLLFVPAAAAAGWVVPAAATADLGYDLLLLALMSREVISVRNHRNYKVLLLLALLATANAAFYVGITGRARWVDPALLAALWVFVLLISVIGGRVVPAFTRNWLRLHGRQRPDLKPGAPPAFDRVDLAATVLLVLFAACTLLPIPPSVTALTGLLSGLLLLARVARWQGFRARGDPMVWILHVAFLWIPVGVLLLSGAAIGWWPGSAGVHALTTGAIATMVVAIASRAALGHTGRPLQSNPVLNLGYAMITLAAVLRVMVVAVPDAGTILLLSAASWWLGFACFAWRYVPILMQPPLELP
jgi:uncharacterized protein involved in response to NO